MSIETLPIEILTEISTSLAYRDIAAWLLTNRQFEQRITPILYRKAESYRSIFAAEDEPHDSEQDISPSTNVRRPYILAWAAKHGHISTINKILAIEDIAPFINRTTPICDSDYELGNLGLAPLHLAALHSHLDVIDLLIQLGADVDTTIQDFVRPIYLARHEATVRCLVRHGSSVHSKDASLTSPLAYSISCQVEPSVIECFLELGSDPNDVSGFSAANMALRAGHLKALELLLNAGYDVSDPSPPEGSPIFRAIGHLQEMRPEIALGAVRLLLDFGAPVDGGIFVNVGIQQVRSLQTNLEYAVGHRNRGDMVRLLLSRGAQADRSRSILTPPWHDNRMVCSTTPLWRLICDYGWGPEDDLDEKISLISDFVAHGAKVDGPYWYATVLHVVLDKFRGRAGWDRVVLCMLDHGADGLARAGDSERRPLHTLLDQERWVAWWENERIDSKASLQVVQRLLDLGSDANQLDDKGTSPLTLACSLPITVSARGIIELLMSHGADVNTVKEDKYDHMTLLDCVLKWSEGEFGGEVFQRCEAIVSTPGFSITSHTRWGFTPLLEIATRDAGHRKKHKANRRRILTLILQRGDGTEIHHRIGPLARPDLRMRSVTYPRDVMFRQYRGGTLLHVACNSRDPDLVKLILEKGGDADINKLSDSGLTPLMVLAKSALEGVTRVKDFGVIWHLLVNAGADTTMENPMGETARRMCKRGLSAQWDAAIAGTLYAGGKAALLRDWDWSDELEDWNQIFL
ncbi:ankyrin repeat-containing domain protein [Ilyonectria sp. MPI-CAGE-AT-0026]|nr:ankyrin repeat-containing domain protein [Ilyonectria sp. MPI-CAGE-AT-0026]